MTEAEREIREAMAAGPTPGKWYHCQPFQSVRAERTIHGPVSAQRVDFVSTNPRPVHERIIIPMAGRVAHVRSEDMAYIAACSPENIAALLAEIGRLRETTGAAEQELRTRLAEIERLTRERMQLRAEHDDLRARLTARDATINALGWQIADLAKVLQHERDCVDAYRVQAGAMTRERDEARTERDVLREAVLQLHATVVGECPSLLNEDSGGSAALIELVDTALAQIEKERSETAKERI